MPRPVTRQMLSKMTVPPLLTLCLLSSRVYQVLTILCPFFIHTTLSMNLLGTVVNNGELEMEVIFKKCPL